MAKTFFGFLKGILLRKEASSVSYDASTEGAVYNENDQKIKAHIDGADREITTLDQTQTLTNKDVDADNNTISNIEVDNLKSGVLDTDLSSVSASDDTLPSAKAVKTYVDDEIALKDQASEISYDNTSSGLSASNCQDAIDEVEGRLDTNESGLSTHISDTTTHGTTGNIVGESDSQTLTNKTIDVDSNTVSNIEVDNLKSGVLDDDLSAVSASHDTLPSAKATKDYVDTELSGKSDTGHSHTATDVTDFDTEVGNHTDVTANTTHRGEDTKHRLINDSGTTTTELFSASKINSELGGKADSSHNHAASEITSGTLAKARGGAAADMSSVTFPSSGTIVTTAATETLTNKKLSGGTASANNAWEIPKDTKSNLDLLTKTEGAIVYASDEDKTYVGDGTDWVEMGSGSGEGGINYISNSNAETDTTGWATYADAAGVPPVDGTGGSANITWTRNTTTPLRGDGDFKLVKDAANRQGEGTSYDFDIDKGMQAKMTQISGWLDSSDAGYADGDMRVYIYDVTNSQVIEPVGVELLGGEGNFKASFQSASDSTSYRLIFHVASTNATAYTLYFDQISVGPYEANFGAPHSDINLYTPTITNLATTSNEGWWIRQGNIMRAGGRLSLGGTPSGNIEIALPAGYTAYKPISVNEFVGEATSYDSGYHKGSCRLTGGLQTFTIRGDDGLSHWNATVPTTWSGTSSEEIYWNIEVPIQGWSSNVQMSDDAAERQVYEIYESSGGESITANVTPIVWSNKVKSAHGAWDGDEFTAPFSGLFHLHGQISTTTSINADVGLYIKPVGGAYALYQNDIDGSTAGASDFEFTYYLNKGEQAQIRMDTSATLSSSAAYHRIAIWSSSGSKTIGATERVGVWAHNNSGESITANATEVPFGTIVEDTHGTWNGQQFVAPIGGKYKFEGNCFCSGAGDRSMGLYINGTLVCESINNPTNSSSDPFSLTYPMNKGDNASVRMSVTSTLSNHSTLHWISIDKI